VKVNLYDEPGAMGPELKRPVVFDVQVCATESRLVAVTVVPVAMTSVDGRNAKLWIASGATFGAVVVVVGAVVCGVVTDGEVTGVEGGTTGDGEGDGDGDWPGVGGEIGGAVTCPEPAGDGDPTCDLGLVVVVVVGWLTTVWLVVRVVLATGLPLLRSVGRVLLCAVVDVGDADPFDPHAVAISTRTPSIPTSHHFETSSHEAADCPSPDPACVRDLPPIRLTSFFSLLDPIRSYGEQGGSVHNSADISGLRSRDRGAPEDPQRSASSRRCR